ncbi:hypothetical protein XJ44_04415 [Thermosipho affectus]|uniref:Uncharacterized protein n=1 Tax=Thermosipho affectus TaxID=660294 RepID=A0ABX3IIL7_9BACT|nr:hypothetical protein XJ44_04415 [Thermosipho affectus]
MSFSEVIISLLISIYVIYACYLILDSTIEWYIFLKTDYIKSLETFYVVNYIRHDFYTRGISGVNFENEKCISFTEKLKNGDVKLVKYKVLDTKDGMFLKREVQGLGNYLGPFKTTLSFKNAATIVYIQTYRGRFVLPKEPLEFKIKKILVSF